MLGYIFKGAVSPVVVKPGSLPLVNLRCAIGFVFGIEGAVLIFLKRPLYVVSHEQVQLAVVVVVEPYGAARKAAACQLCPSCHIGEAAVAKIPEQVAGTYRGDIDVFFAVVVIVADSATHAVHLDG